jgi:hypothetical protein
MERIINKLINEFTKGVDTYTHNGSTWLIFTESKQWMIELTENKTLWYNYNFFKSIFAYASLDCVQNQHLITKWVEDNIINKELTYVTLFRDARDRKQQFEDTLENGVKKTKMAHMKTDWSVEDTIENGVKNTNYWGDKRILSVDDTLENGVKETIFAFVGGSTLAEDVLQNGVKIISPLQSREYTGDIDEVLGNGVKTSHPRQYVGGDIVDKVIDKGVIETHDDVYHHKGRIAGVIKNGVKETKTPGEDGDLVGVLDWLEENETNSVPKMIDDVIENGVKETVAAGYTDPKTNLIYIKWGPQIDEVIDEGVKISRTYISGSRQKETTEIIIKYGTKNPTD